LRPVVGGGSQELLFGALVSAIDPGDQVIIQNPGYMAYIPSIALASGKPVSLELREDENWAVNSDRLKKLAKNKRAKVFILNSPANPTGNVLSKKVLEEIADVAIDNDLYVFSDEAYEKLVYGKKHVSIGSLNGMENHVVTLQTFSKAFSMTGFRVGYAAGSREFMEALTEVHHNISLCAPHASQVVAKFALSMDKKYLDRMTKEYDRRRKFIVKRLNEIGLPTIEPFGAFYSFSNIKKVTRMNSFDFADKLLKKAKVAVVPGSEFGKHGEGYIRCSYATEFKVIEKAMNRLEKFVK